MAVTTGNFGITATPATDLYNLLATALTNNGNWTQTADSPVSAVNAGTTAAVRCWKNTLSPNWFLMIEVDDANSRLRIRAAEELGVGSGASNPARYKIRKFVDGHSSAVNVTANADTTTIGADSDQDIGLSDPTVEANPSVAYTQIDVSTGGFPYLFEVRNQVFTVGTRVAGLNYYCIAGIMPSLVQTVVDSVPLFLMGHTTWPGMNGVPENYTATIDGVNASLAPMNGCKSSRSPNCGTLTGRLFSYTIAPLYGSNNFQYVVGQDSTNYYRMNHIYNIYGAINSGPTHRFFNSPIASPAIIHGIKGQILDPTHVRTFRAYMPDFVVVASGGLETTLGDTLTVNGSVYYPLGWCHYGLDGKPGTGQTQHGGIGNFSRLIVAIKA